MDSQEQPSRLLKQAIIVLLILSIVTFSIGISDIYHSFCKPNVRPLLALIGLSAMLVTIGLGLANSLIMKSLKRWLVTAGLTCSFIIMAFYFYVVSFVRCSGV